MLCLGWGMDRCGSDVMLFFMSHDCIKTRKNKKGCNGWIHIRGGVIWIEVVKERGG